MHSRMLAPVGVACFVGVLGVVACSSEPSEEADEPFDGGSTLDASSEKALLGDAVGDGNCRNLECARVQCESGTTLVSGRVYAPNGTLPIYNAIVYIPNDPLAPIPEGVQCDRCGTIASGSPLSVTLTDATGHFVLEDVPVGNNIPLVVQVGKWRRMTHIKVNPCVNNELTDPELTRLPKNRSEGNMPKIALTTGGCDELGCLLPKLGIDKEEFGLPGEGKVVSTYNSGNGPVGAPEAPTLWKNLSELLKYDMAILSCECSEQESNKGEEAYQAVYDYLAAGGRIFTTDFQYIWYKRMPNEAFQKAATFAHNGTSVGTPYNLVTDFPKGKALADWLAFVEPSSKYGQVTPDQALANFVEIHTKGSWQVWATSPPKDDPSGPLTPRFATVNVPVEAPENEQCGKAVHLDAHISRRSGDTVGHLYPWGCGAPSNGSDKTLAFFFFDLSSCVQKEDAPPIVPK